MSISVFPAVSTAAGPDAQTFSITAAYTTYKINDTFLAGGYTVTTSPSTAQVSIQLLDSSSILIETQTTSGTVSFALPSDASSCYIKDISASTNTTVTITYTAVNSDEAPVSGTLDTITNTSTYNSTGLLYVLAFGGGGGGGGGNVGGARSGGGGGGSGFQTANLLFSNTSQNITIGAQGNGGASGGGAGGAGGTSSFGNLVTAAGGNGGNLITVNAPQVGGNGAAAGGGGSASGSGPGGAGGVSVQQFKSIGNQTVGGGGGGSRMSGAGAGGVGNIGSGGNGSDNPTLPGNAANGYASGGGGGCAEDGGGNRVTAGAAGSPGIVYVLRGF